MGADDQRSPEQLLRADLHRIASLIPHGSRVLDLGCDDGSLLVYLRDERGCTVRGIELDHADIAAAISMGVPVVEADMDEGLSAYAEGSFDYVILSQTLQVVRRPAFVLREMLKVGSKAIVSFPNFGYWRVRGYLTFRGRMPISKSIPFSWYDTPNIHHTTIEDFRDFVSANGGEIVKEYPLRTQGFASDVKRVRVFPNLMADTMVAIVQPAGATTR